MIPVSFTGFYREDYCNTRTVYLGTVMIGTIQKYLYPNQRLGYIVKDLAGDQIKVLYSSEEAEEYAKKTFGSLEAYREELENHIKMKLTAFKITEKQEDKKWKNIQ